MSDGAGKFERLVDGGIENIVRSFFDEYEKENAEFRANAGLPMEVIREEVGDCCDWCADLAGTYDYENAPKEVWQRHEHCRCMVITRTTKGTFQDAWSKKEYQSQREARIAREEEILKEIQQKGIESEGNSDIIKLPDTYIRRAVGAKARNYDIKDPKTDEIFHFVENTRIENSQVFAGYKTKTPLKDETIEGLTEQFKEMGAIPERWQHCKGIGHIDVYGEDVLAEVHWFQQEATGKQKFKVKRWLYDE